MSNQEQLYFIKDRDGYAVHGRTVIGFVERIRVSTDSKIAGTRLRRPGKGRVAWRAIVPVAEREGTRRELQGTFGGGWRLEWAGHDFDTRREAAEALADWHHHPEKRS